MTAPTLIRSFDYATVRKALDLHARYLEGLPGGRRANLSYADLSNFALDGADLSHAEMTGARLNGAILTGARMNGVVLYGADLRDADLRRAAMVRADLRGEPERACVRLSDASPPPVLPTTRRTSAQPTRKAQRVPVGVGLEPVRQPVSDVRSDIVAPVCRMQNRPCSREVPSDGLRSSFHP